MGSNEPLAVQPWFNLIDEAWIPVIDATGKQVEVSLRDLFIRADQWQRLVGDLPTQVFANLRVFLAVLHRAVGGPENVDHWVEIKDHWADTVDAVSAYLDDWHERFWLIHPIHPFMQVADLHTPKDEFFGLNRIVCDGPGGKAQTFLSTRQGVRSNRITWSEAARWLIHAQAYDVAGIHSGAVGDPRVSDNKGPGIGTGWAGQIGGIYLLGEGVRETLLLNLVITGDESELQLQGGLGDRPVWERGPLGSLPEGWTQRGGRDQPYRQPQGPVDLYTWPARRLRLFGDREFCTGAINAQGDRAVPHNRFQFEPMTAWRYSGQQTKNLGYDTYMPLEHDPSRSFWRGLAALLPGSDTKYNQPIRPGGPAPRLPPAMMNWIERLQSAGKMPRQHIDVRAVGIEYGSNKSVYKEIVTDELRLPTALLDDKFKDLVVIAEEAVDVADEAVIALGYLAKNIALAAGASSKDKGPRQIATAQAYDALDEEFRDWIVTLTDPSKIAERRQNWQSSVSIILRGIANRIIREAGPAALVGREANGRHLDAGLADLRFQAKLRQLLPEAFSDKSETTAVAHV
ncbi:MAG: type I-E CRISPR-associated protein Cse1/CasA [Propionibacteriaceae bacterium]|jgi:CRISPR system Cascade subunit CasA|nr:type I-E CRISPR-associated protein Cse1/CasA [Propionibacteriaceae bacterium]